METHNTLEVPSPDSPSAAGPDPGLAPGRGEHTLTIRLAGDVMLGRLCDQLMPTHVDEPTERQHAWGLVASRGGASLVRTVQHQKHQYAWGNTLDLWSREAADVRICNLETSMTTSNDKWPDKAFNYRMHPENTQTLREANFDYCSLANNHTLDFKQQGLIDTMRALERAHIAYAGVGLTREAALKPAILHVKGKVIGCFSFSDHPDYFAATDTNPGINYLDIEHITEAEKASVRHDMMKWRTELGIDVTIVSLHWGSNYCWEPCSEFTAFAHFLIDECRVDVIHGHSSHHVQGVEIYKGKAIIYGCGDLVDDYAVHDDYRNDLSFIYTVTLELSSHKTRHHRVSSIHMIPTHCSLMCITTSLSSDDRTWLHDTMTRLCSSLGSRIIKQPDGTMIMRNTSHDTPPVTPLSATRTLHMKRLSTPTSRRGSSSSSTNTSPVSSREPSPTQATKTISSTATTTTSTPTITPPTITERLTERLSAYIWPNKKDGIDINKQSPMIS